MKIYTPSGELAHKLFTFPDGQPHFELLTEDELDSRGELTIETAIRNSQELIETLLVKDVLANLGYNVGLDVRYLLGARMDRAIDSRQPFTLQTIARLINGAGFTKVRILDAHSEASTRLIRNSVNILPKALVAQARRASGYPWVVCPDKGAQGRILAMCSGYHIRCGKTRNMQDGKLTSFEVELGKDLLAAGARCLIVDDICDGGGTFTGLAKVLREAGAKSVSLFVTHGIFSKGLPLEGIDKVFTTDSYTTRGNFDWGNCELVVISVSMKDMK